MKQKNKNIILFALIACIVGKASSQVTFTVDSLQISEVLWICEDNVVISHFADGPTVTIVCTLTNDSKDTLTIHQKDINVHLNSKSSGREITFYNDDIIDSQYVILPDTSIRLIYERKFFLSEANITSVMNCRLYNFLPFIEKLIKKAEVNIQIEGIGTFTAPINNCFTKNPFCINGAFESIFIPKNNK